jgi:hypothetical protein
MLYIRVEPEPEPLQPYPALEPHDMMRLRNADCRNADCRTADYRYRNADYCNADYRDAGLLPYDNWKLEHWSRMT